MFTLHSFAIEDEFYSGLTLASSAWSACVGLCWSLKCMRCQHYLEILSQRKRVPINHQMPHSPYSDQDDTMSVHVMGNCVCSGGWEFWIVIDNICDTYALIFEFLEWLETQVLHFSINNAVADPDFPHGGAPTHFSGQFCPKLIRFFF